MGEGGEASQPVGEGGGIHFLRSGRRERGGETGVLDDGGGVATQASYPAVPLPPTLDACQPDGREGEGGGVRGRVWDGTVEGGRSAGGQEVSGGLASCTRAAHRR